MTAHTSMDTDRLTLRPPRADDYEDVRRMLADPEVVRHVGGVPLGGDDAWNRLLRDIGHWATFGHGLFVIRERSTGQFVGQTGLATFKRGLGADFDEAPEAAWMLCSQGQGRGFAYEAAIAAHRWYFQHRGIQRTVCIIAPDNTPSLALAQRLGYVPGRTVTYRHLPMTLLHRDPTPLASAGD